MDGVYTRIEALGNKLYGRFIRGYEYVFRRDWLAAIVIAGSIIAVGVFMGYANNQVVPVNTDTAAHYTGQRLHQLDYLSNWDGTDYLYIVAHGYGNVSRTNFFPLYPLLISSISHATSLPPVLVALLISWVSFMGAAYFYIKIVKLLFGTRNTKEAVRALLLFALFPTAVFMIMTYTEALTACMTLAAIYQALRRNWWAAGFFAAVGTATHITGVFALLLVGMILMERGVSWLKTLGAMAIGSIGLLSFMVYLQLKFHDFFGFITAQKQHGWLKHTVHNPAASFGWLNIIMVLLVISAAIYWWPKRKSLAVYSLLFLSIPIAGGQFGGFNRYVLADYAIPLMAWGLVRNHKLAYPLVLSVSLVLWTYFLLQYCGGYVGG